MAHRTYSENHITLQKKAGRQGFMHMIARPSINRHKKIGKQCEADGTYSENHIALQNKAGRQDFIHIIARPSINRHKKSENNVMHTVNTVRITLLFRIQQAESNLSAISGSTINVHY